MATPTPSFTLAPGHPDALFAAAQWHANVAQVLDAHATTIRAAAGSAAAFWQGAAADAYQQLSGQLAFGYETTAGKSADAAATYRRVATEVERCQREGRLALRDAQHWCDESIRDARRVTTAQNDVRDAQQAVHNAQGELTIAAASPDANGHARVAGAQTALRDAQDRLLRAQGTLRAAQHDLDHANQELRRADRRGEQAFQDAEHAVSQVTGLDIAIDPPPMPGLLGGGQPVSPLTMHPVALQPPPHHDGGGFFDDPLGTIERVLSGAPSTLLGATAGAVSVTLPGLALRGLSALTQKTIGVCAGGGVTSLTGAGGEGSLCYESTPSGQSGFVGTVGAGAGAGAGVSGFLGPVVSNGDTLGDQGGGFTYGGGSAGDGPYAGGLSYSSGANAHGRRIWDVSGGWTPSAGSPINVHVGGSYSWTFPAP